MPSQFFYLASHSKRPRIWRKSQESEERESIFKRLQGVIESQQKYPQCQKWQSKSLTETSYLTTIRPAIIDLHSMLSIEDTSQLRGPLCRFAPLPLDLQPWWKLIKGWIKKKKKKNRLRRFDSSVSFSYLFRIFARHQCMPPISITSNCKGCAALQSLWYPKGGSKVYDRKPPFMGTRIDRVYFMDKLALMGLAICCSETSKMERSEHHYLRAWQWASAGAKTTTIDISSP